MSWTEAQKNAIKARGCNLLVAAAAGSGKTAVLVERIIQLVLKDRIDIDRMLIVTFTQAAAGEMKERISKALQAELDNNCEMEKHLRKQLKLLNQASISTIHAFCTDILRRYFHLLGIDPGFRISDNMESDLIKMEALEDLFEVWYEKEDPRFFDLVEAFSNSKNDQNLQELVLRAYEFAQCKPYPQQWIEDKLNDFNISKEDFANCQWITNILKQIKIQVEAAEELFLEALQICYQPGGPVEYDDPLQNDLNTVKNLLKCLDEGNIYNLYSMVVSIFHTRLPRTSKDVDPILKDKAKNLRDEGKRLIKQVGSEFLFKHPDQFLHDLKEIYPLMQIFCRLVIEFTNEYQKRKADKCLLDFNDLEHHALTVLGDQEAAADYREKYEYIFVDEYQDSNEVQECLINCIKKDNNVFLVGDIKQSIYRFRLADPTLFINKMEEFKKPGIKPNMRIDLSTNFRSREEILYGVNYIFSQIMTPYLGEITYDSHAALYPGIECNQNVDEIHKVPIEVYLIDKTRNNDEDGALAEAGDAEIEARLAAQKIKELHGQQYYDNKTGKYRTIEYRDMVILMRSTRNWISAFWDIFAAEGIPIFADSDSGYFETTEISIVINLLRLIDNRRQDIPLLSVMRSPIGEFTLDELIEIRVQSQSGSFYEAIESYLAKNNNDLQSKLVNFMSNLAKWKIEARYMPMEEFIWKLLHDTGYFYYAGAMPGGRQRQANLKSLVDRARQFQNTSIKGLFNFIKYVDKIMARSADMGAARILGENENLVRIMSIHRSKGLEFPIVIIAGLGKQFNLSDSSARILLHKDLGLGPRYVNTDLRIYSETIARVSIKNKIRLENLSEEMRILYVGFTRPQFKLILLGSLRDLEGCCNKWIKRVNPFNLARSKCPMDWIGPVLMRHPDGTALQELSGVSWKHEELIHDSSSWQVNLLTRSYIARSNRQEKEILNDFTEHLEKNKNNCDYNIIKDHLTWNYPYSQAVRIPSKVSVSLLKKANNDSFLGIETQASLVRPRFVDGIKSITPAQKGSIMHFIMQHLDFEFVKNRETIREQIKNMVNQEMLSEDEAEAVNINQIYRFFHSQLGKRILNAREVQREVPFNHLRSAADVLENAVVTEEKLLVQGVIDLFFYEACDIVLVDFKTDYINERNRNELINYYKPQLKLYKEALETIKNQKVKESYLYFFGTEEAVLME